MSKYDNLPEVPPSISSTAIMMRLVDGLGFRYATATKGLHEEFIDFKACESAMSAGQLLKHIYQLVWWVNDSFKIDNPYDKTLDSVEGYRAATLLKIENLSGFLSSCSEDDLANTQIYLKRTDENYSFWYFLNGPIADALTHVGQINSWRRMAGNPIQKISPLNGKSF